MSEKFTDAGFNSIEDGVEMFRVLGVTETTLKDPIEWQKLKEIAQFTSDFQDGASLLKNILMTKKNQDMSVLDYAWEFTKIRNDLFQTEQRVLELRKLAAGFE